MSADLPKIDYRAHPAYGGMFVPNPNLGARALHILEPLIEEMRQVEAERTARFGGSYLSGDPVSAELAGAGVARRQLSAPGIDAIEAATRPLVEEVRARLDRTRAAGEPLKFRTALEPIDPVRDEELWGVIDRTMADLGVYEATAALYGAPGAKLRAASVLVNQPGQDWITRLFRDLEVEAPPTAGLHIDSDGKCMVKSVLYLSDVGPEQGPFSIVPGSHLWGSDQDRILRRAFDKSELVVRSVKKRRMFFSLPEEMQVKAEFGGDMLPGSPQAEALLRQEVFATGPRGQLNLFNPEAVHRGGNVRKGERRVVLITCGPRW